MPFPGGTQGSHDDTQHQGSAKKGIISGVASLDATTHVPLAQLSLGTASGIATLDGSSKVVQEPASKAQVSGIASLDGSSKVVQEPASKAQASGIASLDGSSKVVQEPASKGAASGIASLDASSHVPAAQLALAELLANKNAASGYAGLNASSLIALSQQMTNFKIASLSRDTSAADGNVATTGVGFTPTVIIFLVFVNSTNQLSIGWSNGTNHYSVYDNNPNIAGTYANGAGNAITLMQAAGINTVGVIISMDADGFTLGWTKTGAKTGTATIFYLAIR